MQKTIFLQSIGRIDQESLLKLKKSLEQSLKEFNIYVRILSEEIPLNNSEYDSIERKYNASLILKRLEDNVRNEKYFRTLGIIDKDIFANGLNFVFGIAEKPKTPFREFFGVALISLTRLSENFYGKAENLDLFELRVLKEAIHELGHTFDLGHCKNFCIMQFSNSLTDTDNKPPNFCKSCSIKLKDFFSALI